MSEEAERDRRTGKRFLLISALVALLLIIFFAPSLVSLNRYKSRIISVMSTAMGRPVHLSSVELRLLPRPGFVITNLIVEEDPAFGAEPILHANSVTAAIRLLGLLSGKLEISSISVDEASLNLVRNSAGAWNFDSFLRSATARTHDAALGKVPPFPYLEATNSRINLKNGLEKLPYSLVNADLSFWQENPGDWRLRVHGQPARTDVSLDLADTGIVRLEARLYASAAAHDFPQYPVHLQMEWREAQLGQLSRLILGSDPGWRGNLTGEVQLDGTPETAQVKTRLSATGVHRAEFAPADPLDFDANCNFVYHYFGRAVENLSCDSPLGDGHIRIASEAPGNLQGKSSVQIQRIPVSAALAGLRTLRNGISESVDARGTISGELIYDPSAAEKTLETAPANRRAGRSQPAKVRSFEPLQGSLTVDSFRLTSDSLNQPIQIAKITLQPAAAPLGVPQELTSTVSIPAGGLAPLSLALRLTMDGYVVNARGPASFARLRDLAHLAGIANVPFLQDLAGDPPTLDLTAQGRWLPSAQATLSSASFEQSTDVAPGDLDPGRLTGTIVFHNANWKSDALAAHVEIPQATLHLGEGAILWDPVTFAYGAVKGNATFRVPTECDPGTECPPQLALRFADLDAGDLESSLLGVHPKGTVLSNLIARLTPATPQVWPRLDTTLSAGSLQLGPAKLESLNASFKIMPASAEITSLDAQFLGGKFVATGKLENGATPGYSLVGTFAKVSGSALCQWLAVHCMGGAIQGDGKVQLTGFSDRDLASSAEGTVHFDWRHGALEEPSADQAAKETERFDRWTAEVSIANNRAAVRQNQMLTGTRKRSLNAVLTFADPPTVSFLSPEPSHAEPQ
jgi:AsmA family/AsmA-like C-terminal region